MNWDWIPLRDVLQIALAPVTLREDIVYQQAVLRPYPYGVVLKAARRGFDFPHKNQRIIHAGQFLISKTRANRKIWGIVPPELDGAVVTQGYLSFNIRHALNHPYFAAYLATKIFQQAVFAACTVQGRLVVQQFGSIAVPLPPPDVQVRIANVWEYATAALEHSTEMLSSMAAIRAGVMRDLFQGDNSAWERQTLGNCTVIRAESAGNHGVTILLPDQIILRRLDRNAEGIAIVPNDELDSRFLYYFLQSQKSALLAALSDTRANYNDILRALPINLPTLYHQRRIASLMEAHDEALLRLRQEKSALYKLVQGIMHGIFSGTLNLQDAMPILQNQQGSIHSN